MPRRTLDALPNIVWTSTPEGAVEFVNARWRAYTGLSLTQTAGDGWAAAFHPDDLPALAGEWEAARRSGGTARTECRLRRADDGAWRWHVWSLAPVIGAGGAVARWIGTAADVHEHREAERRAGASAAEISRLNADLNRANAALSDRLGEMQALLDVVPAGIEISDGTPDAVARTCRPNPALARMVGVPPGGNLAPPPPRNGAADPAGADAGAPGAAPPLPFTIRRGGPDGPMLPVEQMPTRRAELTGREVRDQEITVVRADGRVVELLGFASPLLGVDGRPRGAVGIYLDITGRKAEEAEARRAKVRAEQSRAAAEAAKEAVEAASRAKDQFLAMLSHELRTPLTPVLAAVSDLRSDLAARPGAAADDLATLDMVQRNVELEARLIDDLLDLTKIARGKLRLERRPTDVHALVRAVIEMCRAESPEEADGARAAAPITVDLSARRAVVDADPARLQQVLWNLVKNALKFTPPDGSITVRTSNAGSVDLDADGADGANGSGRQPWLRVEVSDTGIGIDPEALPRIFFAFEQIEAQNRAGRRRAGGGLGLGLTISKSLVDMHGGRLRVRSGGEGRGSTFTAELECVAATAEAPDAAPRPAPALPAAPSAARPAAAESAPPAGRPRLLLVDDHEDTNRAMKRVLGRLGYAVTTAASVADALAADAAAHDSADGPFDLLLSDIGLPDGSGLDLMRQLCESRPVRGIALSGFGTDADVQRSRDAGFAEHLTKPVSLDKLRDAIARLV